MAMVLRRKVLITGIIHTISKRHVVIEHGSLPNDGLYHDLVPNSHNEGITDIAALIAGEEQNFPAQGEGGFSLCWRCVASRNIHAAILDARRLFAKHSDLLLSCSSPELQGREAGFIACCRKTETGIWNGVREVRSLFDAPICD